MASSEFAILLVIITLSGLGSAVLEGAIRFQLYIRELDRQGKVTGYVAANPPTIRGVAKLTCIQFETQDDLYRLQANYSGSGKRRIIFVGFDDSKGKFVVGKFSYFDSKIPLPLKADEAGVHFICLSNFSDYIQILVTEFDIEAKPDTSLGHMLKEAVKPKSKAS